MILIRKYIIQDENLDKIELVVAIFHRQFRSVYSSWKRSTIRYAKVYYNTIEIFTIQLPRRMKKKNENQKSY